MAPWRVERAHEPHDLQVYERHPDDPGGASSSGHAAKLPASDLERAVRLSLILNVTGREFTKSQAARYTDLSSAARESAMTCWTAFRSVEPRILRLVNS